MNAIYIEETGLEDSVLNEERGPQNLEEFEEAEFGYTENILEQLSSDYQVAVLTNQPDVEKHERDLSEDSLRKINNYLIEQGADIVIVCPHRPDNHEEEYSDVRLDGFLDNEDPAPRTVDREYGCGCHKPDESMYRFLDQFTDIDYGSSISVGDKSSDLKAAVSHSPEITTAFLHHYPDREPPENADFAFDDVNELTSNLEHIKDVLKQ